MLHADVVHVVDAECRAVFGGAACPDLPHPCIEELSQLAAVVAADLRVVRVRRSGQLVALSVCSVEDVRVHGVKVRAYRMFGEALHDYTRLYSKDAAALSYLLSSIRQDARRCNCDAVALNSFLLAQDAHVLPRRYTNVNTTVVFDSARDPKGWEGLLSRKSLRRHWNGARRKPGFQVHNSQGGYTRWDIEKLAALHRERWHFEGETSAFDRAARVDEYLTHSSNKLLTQVLEGDEVVAMHYGMQYRNTLLWHTPVVNIKFLAYSPLEVLLTAVAQYCQTASIVAIDFGVGDEKYKARFGNSVRTTYSVFFPISAKAYFVQILRIGRLHKFLKSAAIRLRYGLSRIRARVKSLRAEVEWYEADGVEDGKVLPHGLLFVVIDSFEEFVDFCRRYRLSPRRHEYLRFREGEQFCALHGARDVFTYGWLVRRDVVRIGEIERSVDAKGRTIVYDFFTLPEFRRQGHYTTILEALKRRFPGERLAIYVQRTNTASLAAIRKAGFGKKATLDGGLFRRIRKVARKNSP